MSVLDCPFAARADLSLSHRPGRWGVETIVHDPLRLEYFLLTEEEMRVWQLLQQPRTIPELHRALSEQPGSPLEQSEVIAFVHKLCADNLVQPCRLGNGGRLSLQADRERRQRRLAWGPGLLAIKLPGVAADPWLSVLKGCGGLLFHPLTLLTFCLASLATLIWAALSFPVLWSRMPGWMWFMTPSNLVWLFVGYLVVKSFHELGHGLACKYYGGRVREMGVLLLFFTPCLYCDASDAWRIPERGKRIMISLAGVYVEMIFALGFFWAWWLASVPNTAAWLFGMLLTTSINTLLVNGNPLLKFDGYFALSDYWNVPNLTAVSRQQWNRLAESVFFQTPQTVAAAWETKLVLYAALSWLYRWSILLSIFTAVYWVLRENRLEAMAVLASVGLAVAVLGLGTWKVCRDAARQLCRPHKRWRSWLAVGMMLALHASWLMWFPLERRVYGPAILQLDRPQRLYATQSGQLLEPRLCGQTIEAGQRVVSIEHPLWRQRQIELEGEWQVLNQQLRGKRLEREALFEQSAEIEFLEQKLENLTTALADLEKDRQSGQIWALRQGRLFPPVAEHGAPTPPGQAPRYEFLPSKLVPDKAGSFVDRGELLGLIGDPTQLIGVLSVSHFEMESIRPGQLVKLRLPHSSQIITGKVRRIDPPAEIQSVAEAGQTDLVPAVGARVSFEVSSVDPDRLRPGTTLACLVEVESTTPWGYLRLWLRRWLLRIM